MSFIFDPPPVVALPVVGGAQLFPVHRIYCVGRNYVEHAQEMGFSGREPPLFFCKPADAAVNVPAGGEAVFPYPSASDNVHHEMELVVAIGKGGRDIKAADAVKHIFGYAAGLDMTRRDLQGEAKKQGRPWETGKAFDHSAPIGPIHPITATGEIKSGAITLAINGTVKQSSDVSKLIWSVNETIEHLSVLFELKPGDLIFTGTPEGVGKVVRGDVMTGAIAKLGEIRVRVA